MASYFGNKDLKPVVYIGNNKITHICFGESVILHTAIDSIPLDGFALFSVEDDSVDSSEISVTRKNVTISNVNLEKGTAFINDIIVELTYETVITGSRDITIYMHLLEGSQSLTFVKTVNFIEGYSSYVVDLTNEPIYVNLGSGLKDYVKYTQVWGAPVIEFEPPIKEDTVLNVTQVYNATQIDNTLEVE